MIRWVSKTGIIVAGLYVALSAYLIATQGLFGESFIAILLGMPWTLVLALIEFGGAEGSLLYVLILAPIVLNTALIYWLAATISSRWSMPKTPTTGGAAQ